MLGEIGPDDSLDGDLSPSSSLNEREEVAAGEARGERGRVL